MLARDRRVAAGRRFIRRDDGHGRPGGRDLAMALRERDDDLRPGKIELEGEIVGAQVRVDGLHRNAERIEREPVEHEGRPVLEQQRDPRAVPVAGRRVSRPQAFDFAGCFAIGDAEAVRCVGQLGRARRKQKRCAGIFGGARRKGAVGRIERGWHVGSQNIGPTEWMGMARRG